MRPQDVCGVLGQKFLLDFGGPHFVRLLSGRTTAGKCERRSGDSNVFRDWGHCTYNNCSHFSDIVLEEIPQRFFRTWFAGGHPSSNPVGNINDPFVFRNALEIDFDEFWHRHPGGGVETTRTGAGNVTFLGGRYQEQPNWLSSRNPNYKSVSSEATKTRAPKL